VFGRARTFAACLILLSLLGIVGASCDDDDEPPQIRSIHDLIKPPEASQFQVDFVYERGAPGGTDGLVTWRQSGPSRRWDIAWGPRFISLQVTDADSADISKKCEIDCEGLVEQARGEAEMNCSETAAPNLVMSPLSYLLDFAPTTEIAFSHRERIADVDAECYDTKVFDRSALLCVDPSLGAPVMWDAFDLDGTHHTIRAARVSTEVEELTDLLAIPRTYDPITMNLSKLGLPLSILELLNSPPSPEPQGPQT
jgi:hypothetical protein